MNAAIRGRGVSGCLVLAVLASWCSTGCQSDHKALSVPSKIEAAQTAAQLQQLLRSVDTLYNQFTIDTVLRLQDKRVERRYRQAGIKAWYKADLDGNDRTDVVVTGWLDYGAPYPETSQVVCLLDMGDSLVLDNLNREYERYGPIARVVYRQGRPLLQYHDFAPPILYIDSLRDEQTFLLTYKFGGFVEYNERPDPGLRIDSLTYTSDFAYDDVLMQKLTLTALGQAEYRSCEYPVPDERKKTFVHKKTQVADPAMAEINGLLGYIVPDKLKPEYRVYMNHNPYTYLTLSYHDGRRKKVFDYGEKGTFGLMRLYALLAQLHKTQQWQPIK
ncbi:hypothetical protein GCM10027048_21880 [Hymenobacter coalescens]